MIIFMRKEKTAESIGKRNATILFPFTFSTKTKSSTIKFNDYKDHGRKPSL